VNIGIVGLGLIGGSLAGDIKARVKDARIFGYDCCERTVEKARESGLFEQVFSKTDNLTALVMTDIIIVAVSVASTADTIRKVYDAVGDKCIITDVCSVKGHLSELSSLWGIRLVGGHPMAGTEKSGFEAGREGLFDGAVYIVTPYPSTNKSDLNTVIKLVETIGAKPLLMEAEEHDTLASRASHLPHMIAYALSDHVIRDGEPYIAGKGFTDMIRIASSSPEFWTEVAEANRDNMIKELDTMILRLADIKGMIERGDWEKLEKRLEQGRKKREQNVK